MQQVELIATTAFGLEAIVEREVQKLGYTDTKVEDGRVRFKGDLTAICKANLWLRSAERVQLVIGEFHCPDFEQLFERTKEMPWEEWLTVDALFPVYAKSVKSMLTATPSVQRAVKKAIVERLKTKHNRVWFDEEGPEYAIEISLLNDRALLTIDTSGEGLHKRGYRQLTTEAPLKETLAAAMIQLSYWNRDRILVDPFCGSGTIPIEAALIARNMPPGGNRTFAAENWPQVSIKLWTEARKEARDQRLKPLEQSIIATDMDSQVIRLARKHASDAGVGTDIHFERKMFAEFNEYREYGVMICNPPYGERMGDRETVDRINEDFGEIIRMHPTWSFYCLTSHPWFERQAGAEASRRRKLYNGRIECTYYQYQGPRPPREAALAEAEAEAAVPPPPLDFKPNKPPTRGPAAGQVIDTVTTPLESSLNAPEPRGYDAGPTSTGGISVGLINRMKTLDFKPNKPPVRGPMAAPTADESDNSPVSGESSATPGVTSVPESAPAAATTQWTRPIPAPPLDFKPMRPPTRGPFAAESPTRGATIADVSQQSSGDKVSSESPAVTSAPDVASPPVAKEWSRPIPPPPLDFKPMRPPTRGPLAQPKSLADLAASGTTADAMPSVSPKSKVIAPGAVDLVEPEVSPAVPVIEPPKPSEILAPSPVEPVRPAGLSLADLASRATPPQMDIADGVG